MRRDGPPPGQEFDTVSGVGILTRTVIVCLLLGAAAIAQPTGTADLSAALAKWRDDIEATGNRKVIVARFYFDQSNGNVFLPHDIPERPLLLPYFRNTNFLRELLATHALSISQNLDEDSRSVHFILLNMARQSEWLLHEEAVIGHEMGHIWLFARDYASPVYEGKGNSCLAILTGEIVQHGLIREEMAHRKIDYPSYWRSVLDQSLLHLESSEPEPAEKLDTCRLMSQMSTWVDVRLGLSSETWPNYDRFMAQMRRHFPILEQNTADLYEQLHEANLRDPKVYQEKLEYALHQMYGFVKAVLDRDEAPQMKPAVKTVVIPPVDG